MAETEKIKNLDELENLKGKEKDNFPVGLCEILTEDPDSILYKINLTIKEDGSQKIENIKIIKKKEEEEEDILIGEIIKQSQENFTDNNEYKINKGGTNTNQITLENLEKEIYDKDGDLIIKIIPVTVAAPETTTASAPVPVKAKANNEIYEIEFTPISKKDKSNFENRIYKGTKIKEYEDILNLFQSFFNNPDNQEKLKKKKKNIVNISLN